jgi:hypothetical protein
MQSQQQVSSSPGARSRAFSSSSSPRPDFSAKGRDRRVGFVDKIANRHKPVAVGHHIPGSQRARSFDDDRVLFPRMPPRLAYRDGRMRFEVRPQNGKALDAAARKQGPRHAGEVDCDLPQPFPLAPGGPRGELRSGGRHPTNAGRPGPCVSRDGSVPVHRDESRLPSRDRWRSRPRHFARRAEFLRSFKSDTMFMNARR